MKYHEEAITELTNNATHCPTMWVEMLARVADQLRHANPDSEITITVVERDGTDIPITATHRTPVVWS